MNWHRTRRLGRPLWIALLALAPTAPAAPAHGQESSAAAGGIYFGLALPAGILGATMQKTVDNTAPNTLVPDPRRGRIFRDSVSGGAAAYGVALMAGYRLPVGGGSWFLDGDVGAGWHGGGTEAQFAGVGVSSDRRQLGESWPDSWMLAKNLSYGATLRFGGAPGGPESRGISLYLLAGVRFASADFTNNYTGCFMPEPCEPSQFESGTEDREMDFTILMSGLGLEKQLGDRLAIRAEATYSVYGREEWTTPFEDVGVMVFSSMDASELGLSVGLVRRF